MLKNFKEISVIMGLVMSAYFSLYEKYFPLQFVISLFIAWKLSVYKNDENLKMIVAIGVIFVFSFTIAKYNKKAQKETLSIETRVKIAQEKCLYEYKVEELKFKDNIGMLTEDKKKFEYQIMHNNFTKCLNQINKYKDRLRKREYEKSQRLMNIIDPDRKIRNEAKKKLNNK